MAFRLRTYLDKRKVIRELGSFDCAAMVHAAGEGKLACLNILIEAKLDINCQDHRGHTPLHAAVICQHIPIIHRLLSSGASPNIQDKSGQTPLMHAIGTGDKHIFELLTEYEADLTLADHLGEDALFKAIKAGDTTLTRKILMSGPDVNRPNAHGETPLMLAVDHERIGIVKSLLGAGADPNMTDKAGESVLDRTMASPRIKKMLQRASMQHRFGEVNVSNTPIDIPVSLVADSLLTQFPRTSNLLLNLAGNFLTNINEQVPLDEMEQKGRSVLAQLASFGLRPKSTQNGNGHRSSHQDDIQSNPTELNAALFEVTAAGSDQLVKVLLELGADPNTENKVGKTPLFFALNHQSTVAILLERGADPYHLDHEAKRPIDLARQLGKPQLVSLMATYPDK